MITVGKIQEQLEARINDYPYIKWPGKQNDEADRLTKWIYKEYRWEVVKEKLQRMNTTLGEFAINRWFNFWSAKAVENIFKSHPSVTPNPDPYDKLWDFQIKYGEDYYKYDHKTSVIPYKWDRSHIFTQQNPDVLLEWLVDNQSQEGRCHYSDRLYIVVWDTTNPNNTWKMKANLQLLYEHIYPFLDNYDPNKSYQYKKSKMYNDIILVTR